MSEFEEWFNDNFKALSFRFPSMKLALEAMLKNGGKLIVETGTIRMVDDWGAGMSTYVFGKFCQKYNCRLITVDISPENMSVSKSVTKNYSEFIEYHVTDSIEFLRNFKDKIDLLYLDSVDCPIDAPEDDKYLVRSQKHNLTELLNSLKNLHDGSIVLLDDCDFKNGGKPKLTREFLSQTGWTEIYRGQQSLWTRAPK